MAIEVITKTFITRRRGATPTQMMMTQTLLQIRDALSIEDPAEALASICGEIMALSLHRAGENFEAEEFREAIYQSNLYIILAQKYAPGNREGGCLAYALRGKARYHMGDFYKAIVDLNMTQTLFFENTNAPEDEEIEDFHLSWECLSQKRRAPEGHFDVRRGTEKKTRRPDLTLLILPRPVYRWAMRGKHHNTRATPHQQTSFINKRSMRLQMP